MARPAGGPERHGLRQVPEARGAAVSSRATTLAELDLGTAALGATGRGIVEATCTVALGATGRGIVEGSGPPIVGPAGPPPAVARVRPIRPAENVGKLIEPTG